MSRQCGLIGQKLSCSTNVLANTHKAYVLTLQETTKALEYYVAVVILLRYHILPHVRNSYRRLHFDK